MTLWNNKMILLAAGLCLIMAAPSHAQQKQMKDESVVDQLTDTVSEVAEEVSDVAGDVVEEVSDVAEDVAEELSTITDSDSDSK